MRQLSTRDQNDTEINNFFLIIGDRTAFNNEQKPFRISLEMTM